MKTSRFLVGAAAAAAMVTAGCSRDEAESGEAERTPTAGQEETAAKEPDKKEKDGEKDDRMLGAPSEEQLGAVPEGHGLELGAELPDVTLHTASGDEVNLREVAGDKPVLVGFLRTGSCAYCTFQVRELAESYGDIEKRDLVHVLITVDELDEAAELEASYELPFPLLTDSGLGGHEAFEVVAEGEGEDEPWGIPSLFLFNADGELVWQHVDKDITVRPRIEQILHVLDDHGFVPTA